jgi:hypothetical protein
MRQQYIIQKIQENIQKELQRKLQAAQPGIDDAQRKIQEIVDSLQRKADQADLDFQGKVNKHQRKGRKGPPNHQQDQTLLHKIYDMVEHRYEKDDKFRQRVDEIFDKMVEKIATELKDRYSRWKETTASDIVRSPSVGFSIVDYPVEVTWDGPKQHYRKVKDREQPDSPEL